MTTSNLDTFTYIHPTNIYGATVCVKAEGTKVNKMKPLKELIDFLIFNGLH